MPDLKDRLLDRLGVVNAMAHRATTAAGKIKEAAGGREQSSAAEVEGLRAQIRKAGIGEDPDAEKRYCRLLMDRGRLAQAFTLAEQDEGRFDDLSPVSTSLRKGLSMGEFDLYGAAFEYADDLPPVRLNGPDYDVALFEFHDNLYAGPEVFASYLRGAAGEDPVLGEFGAWLEKAARRKAEAGQATFDFDEEAHPRAPKGGAHGGEFVKREPGVTSQPVARSGKDITDDQFQGMLRAAQDWRYLQMKNSDAIVGNQEKLSHARSATKGDQDQWLMDRFNIEPDMARKISNKAGMEMDLPYWSTRSGTQWKPGLKRPEPTFDQYPELKWRSGADGSGESNPPLAADNAGGDAESTPPDAPPPAWSMSAARYQHLAGVEQPFMMEISSHQMGLMSERQKKRYMADRAAQWDASAAVKGEWREKVIAAWDAGEITPQTPGLDPEAKAAITTEQIARDQQEAKGRVEAALDANQITAAGQVKVGDRVFDLLSGRYGTVDKKFKSGVRFAPQNREGGYHMEPYTVNARRLQWQSYNDAQAAAGGEPLAKAARQDTPDGDTAMPPAAAMGTGMQPQGAEQPEGADELNERHKRDKSLGVGELDVPEEAVPQPQPARGADGKPLAEYPRVKKAATREYVPPDMPRWKKHPGGEAYLPLNGVENRDKYRGMVAAFEDGSFTWYTPLVRCGDQLITGSHRYNAAKAAGAQVQTVTLDELFRENGQDFQTLWDTYAQPFDGWLSNLSYCLEFLPAEVKAAYGIDLG